jgi:predicted nucleic acid-binding protein
MNVVDSSCWLEYLMGTDIGMKVASVIEDPDELVVPTITLYEVYKKLLAEKSEEYALKVVSYMQTGRVVELSAELSLSAAEVGRKHKLAMADSIIYATRCTIQRQFFLAINISKIFRMFATFRKPNSYVLRMENS